MTSTVNVFSTKDQGIGFPFDHQQNLFLFVIINSHCQRNNNICLHNNDDDYDDYDDDDVDDDDYDDDDDDYGDYASSPNNRQSCFSHSAPNALTVTQICASLSPRNHHFVKITNTLSLW